MDDTNIYRFPVDRMPDNRLRGLLREIAEAIQEEGDAERLRALGQSLALLAGRARSKGFDLSKPGAVW